MTETEEPNVSRLNETQARRWRFFDDFSTHAKILRSSGDTEEYTPLIYGNDSFYVVLKNVGRTEDAARIRSFMDYEDLDRQLGGLVAATDPDGEPLIEAGAISTARTVLQYLQTTPVAAPRLTTTGGDAVVMLWAHAGTTCAVTITDNEIGYVIRKDLQTLKKEDSISVQKFDLLRLTHDG